MHLCVLTFRNGVAIGFNREKDLETLIEQLRGLLEAKKTGKRRPGKKRYAVWGIYSEDPKTRMSNNHLDIALEKDQVAAAVALIGDDVQCALHEVDPLELLAMIEEAAGDHGRDT